MGNAVSNASRAPRRHELPRRSTRLVLVSYRTRPFALAVGRSLRRHDHGGRAAGHRRAGDVAAARAGPTDGAADRSRPHSRRPRSPWPPPSCGPSRRRLQPAGPATTTHDHAPRRPRAGHRAPAPAPPPDPARTGARRCRRSARRADPGAVPPVGQATAWGCGAALGLPAGLRRQGLHARMPRLRRRAGGDDLHEPGRRLPRHVGDRHRRPLPAGLHERGVQLLRDHRGGRRADRSSGCAWALAP